VKVRAFRPVRIAVLVKEHVTGAARARFEASIRARVNGLGARLGVIAYVPDDAAAVTGALAAAVARGPDRADIVLAAGGASTDPADPFFVAVYALGGRIVRHGVPAHPGSMLWMARVDRTTVVGLPSCGAYSRATAADLLLPRLVAGQPPSATTVARLAHGGILTRSQRFRFPAYARDLDAPEG
jgi:molybdopterin biosynthesis enzyme